MGVILFSAIIIIGILIVIKNIYNLYHKRKGIELSFKKIEEQLRFRNYYIPNLVSVVRIYAANEKDKVKTLTELRAIITNEHLTADRRVAINNQLSSTIQDIEESAKNYPDLLECENFIILQRKLSEIELQISESCIQYNDLVSNYNNSIHRFTLLSQTNMIIPKDRKPFKNRVSLSPFYV